MISNIKKSLTEVRQKKPLILNLTNFVTVDLVANCLLALGAAPIMSSSDQELEELIKISSAVYINIGTLDDLFIPLARLAIVLAKRYGKPVILDPVGAGATKIRTNAASEFLLSSNIIRGNASEIIALGEIAHSTKGVESSHSTFEAKDIAQTLARKHNTTIVVSGAIDIITDGKRMSEAKYGSELMQYITGMGCAMTAIIAAFHAVIQNPFEASSIATHYFTLCGEVVAVNNKAPGSFRSAFIDQLYQPNFKLMEEIYDK